MFRFSGTFSYFNNRMLPTSVIWLEKHVFFVLKTCFIWCFHHKFVEADRVIEDVYTRQNILEEIAATVRVHILRSVYSDTTQLTSTLSWVASAGRYRHFADATQLNSTSSGVELSCVAIDTLTDATQLSPTIGNATDPVAAYSQSARSRSVELSWVASCIGVAIDTSPTQLNSTQLDVELSWVVSL